MGHRGAGAEENPSGFEVASADAPVHRPRRGWAAPEKDSDDDPEPARARRFAASEDLDEADEVAVTTSLDAEPQAEPAAGVWRLASPAPEPVAHDVIASETESQAEAEVPVVAPSNSSGASSRFVGFIEIALGLVGLFAASFWVVNVLVLRVLDDKESDPIGTTVIKVIIGLVVAVAGFLLTRHGSTKADRKS